MVMNIDGNENLGIWSGFTNFVIIEYDKYDETLFNRNSSDSSRDRKLRQPARYTISRRSK